MDNDKVVDLVAIVTLMAVFVSSRGSSLILNYLVQGQEYQGVFNQLDPTC